mgnify:CR=1 FL=1
MKKLIIILFLIPLISNANGVVDSLRDLKLKLKESSADQDTIILVQKSIVMNLRFSDPEKALEEVFTGIEMANKSGNPKMQETMFNQLGNIYFDKGKFDFALNAYFKSLTFSKSIPDTGAVAYTFNDIGYIYSRLNLFDLSEKYYKEAIKWSFNWWEKEILAHSYNNLAWVFEESDQIDSAYKYFNEAFKIRLKEGNFERIAHSHSYLGLMELNNFRNYDKAIEHFKKSIDLFDIDGTWVEGKIYNFLYLAIAYQQIGENEEAEKNFEIAVKQFESISYQKRVSLASASFAEFLYEIEDYPRSIEMGTKALKIANENHYIEEGIQASEILHKAYEKTGDFKNALEAHKQMLSFKDSVYNSQLIKQASVIESDIKTMDFQKEKDQLISDNKLKTFIIIIIIILAISLIVLIFNRYKHQQLSAQKLLTINQRLEDLNNELEKANITKDRFFSIIAHDLKNPIGSLKGTIEVLHKDYSIFDEEDIQEYLKQLNLQSTGVQELLENLLTWSRSQRGKITLNPVEINLNYLVKNNFDLLYTNVSKKSILLENRVKDDFEIKADVNMINTVLRNLISNAIKFTPEGGIISVEAIKGEDNIKIKVKDTGIGIPEDVIPKLFEIDSNITTEGTNQEKGTGLGLIVCKEFIERHDGKIRIESEVGKGTEFIITLPS